MIYATTKIKAFHIQASIGWETAHASKALSKKVMSNFIDLSSVAYTNPGIRTMYK
jgi:hypothetical protein